MDQPIEDGACRGGGARRKARSKKQRRNHQQSKEQRHRAEQAEAEQNNKRQRQGFSMLRKVRDKVACSEVLKEALEWASGTGARTDMTDAIYAAVGLDDRRELFKSLARLVDEPAASETALA